MCWRQAIWSEPMRNPRGDSPQRPIGPADPRRDGARARPAGRSGVPAQRAASRAPIRPRTGAHSRHGRRSAPYPAGYGPSGARAQPEQPVTLRLPLGGRSAGEWLAGCSKSNRDRASGSFGWEGAQMRSVSPAKASLGADTYERFPMATPSRPSPCATRSPRPSPPPPRVRPHVLAEARQIEPVWGPSIRRSARPRAPLLANPVTRSSA